MDADINTLSDKMDRLTEQIGQLRAELALQNQAQQALWELGRELQPVANQLFARTIEDLDRLERQGYFDFARELAYIAERIVTAFSQEDVRALGDNIVTILTTVRNMTQPEVLAVADRAVATMQSEPEQADLSTIGLLRELGNPQVRKGLARTLHLLKAMADQPPVGSPN